MRHPARADAARRRCLLRPSADDGPRRARRRRARSRRRRHARSVAALLARDPATLSRSWSSSTTTPPRCRTAPSPPASCAPSWRGSSAPAAMSAAPRGRAFDARKTPGYPPYDQLAFDVPVLRDWRRQCPRLGPHPRGRAEPGADRADPRSGCPTARSGPTSIGRRDAAKGWRCRRRFAATCWLGAARRRRPHRALPPARPVLVPMAAAGSRDRRQHRRRLPALQQIVQLLLFGTRSLGRSHAQAPVREPAAPAADRSRRRSRTTTRWPSWRRASTARRAGGSAAACRSARSMPARATAASSRSTRSTMPSTISSASACASSPRRAMPTCCWSPGR